MDKMQTIFRTEAEELVSDLERSLLLFEKDLKSMDAVQEIFRVMHTLKGSASMFGFDSLSALTHDLETIYDEIRNGKAAANDEVLDVTLECVDHIKQLITDPALLNSESKETHQCLLLRIKKLLTSPKAETPVISNQLSHDVSSYYILFKPGQQIFTNGTNPLFLIDDLANIGETFVLPVLDQIPDIEAIDPAKCHVSFEVILVTSNPIDTIKEVFIFVEDVCEILIEKISDQNILTDKQFVDSISSKFFYPASPALGLEKIRNLSNALKSRKQIDVAKDHATKKESATIRVSSDKLDELMNLVSELVTSQARLTLLTEQHGISELLGVAENMDKLTRRLRDNAFNICLVPVETLVIRFQRLVRDLAKDLHKNIEFVAEGTETELDRSIIEKITDPILHILRNSIDHGIESPAERIASGKPPAGTIRLKAFHAGTNVIIQITDDGKGIDKEVIRRKAIERNIIEEQAVLSDSEILNLIFAAGFSTAEKVTGVSGRGVGMDIVKRNIENLHGEVSMESEKGRGTKLTIKLPLTLSILDGMLVRIGGSTYLLPLSIIQTCYEIHSGKISSDIAQKHTFGGELLPVFNLQAAFKCRTEKEHIMQVIRIAYDEFPVGISVDSIIGEYQAVMKPLGEMYKGHDEFSGATILGDGTVALVLDTNSLVRQLMNQQTLQVNNN